MVSVSRWKAAKESKINDVFECPSCGRSVIKTVYNRIFCSKKCKDKFWNTVDPEKRCRKTEYYYKFIEPSLHTFEDDFYSNEE